MHLVSYTHCTRKGVVNNHACFKPHISYAWVADRMTVVNSLLLNPALLLLREYEQSKRVTSVLYCISTLYCNCLAPTVHYRTLHCRAKSNGKLPEVRPSTREQGTGI